MVRTISIALAICSTAAFLSCSEASSSPPVQLNLMAPWAAPDPFLEIAETVEKQKPSSYMSLVGDLLTVDRTLPLYQQYQQALALTAEYLDGEEELDILKLNLAIHSSAPVIEAHRQYYNQSVIPSTQHYDPSCEVWAQVGAHQACSVEELEAYLRNIADDTANNSSDDHANLFENTELEYWYCQTCSNVPKVVVYTSSINTQFATFHHFLMNKVNQGSSLIYALRYKPFSGHHGHPLILSGYGVELALKNTDYLVIDDRNSGAKEQLPKDTSSFIKKQVGNLGKKVNQVLFDFVDDKATIEPLTTDEITLLGLKATQFVTSSDNPLATLTQLSQDFPKYAHKISTINLKDDIVNEVNANQRKFVKGGANALWINGRKLEDDEINPFFTARALERERSLITTLAKLGGTRQQVIDVITNPMLSHDEHSALSSGSLQDVYDVRESLESKAVIWWNDLEKDNRYKSWRPELSALLRPTYPGQMRTIRRNIYNVIMVEDLASKRALHRLTNEIRNMVKQGTPVRFGIVPFLSGAQSASSLAGKSLQYLVQAHGRPTAMTFLEQIQLEADKAGTDYATEDIVYSALSSVLSSLGVSKSGVEDTWSAVRQREEPSKVKSFLKRMGIKQVGKDEGILFLNGQYLQHNGENPWTRVLMNAMNVQTQMLTRGVYLGEINDEDNVLDFFLDQPYVSQSRNPYLAVSEFQRLQMVSFPDVNYLKENVSYLQTDESVPAKSNIWVVGDLDSYASIKLALDALRFIEKNHQARLALIHIPSETTSPTDASEAKFSDIVYQALYDNKVDIGTLKQLLETQWIDSLSRSHQPLENEADISQKVVKTKILVPGSPIINTAYLQQAYDGWSSLYHALLCEGSNGDRKNCFIQNGKPYPGIIVNGRVVGPFTNDDDEFSVDDFDSLWQLEETHRIDPMMNALQHAGWKFDSKDADLADTIMYFNCILEADKQMAVRNTLLSQEDGTTREKYYAQMDGDYTRTYINKNKMTDKDEVYAEIGVLLNPLCEEAQKWSTLLNVLSELSGVAIDIYWNPVPHLQELPLKRFYRYVLDHEWQFDSDKEHHSINTPTAYFENLPVDALYTLGVETINSWHVTVKDANVDLDNIQLKALMDDSSSGGDRVYATYELERILVEGHCVDGTNQHPPRGLQFVLGTETHPTMTDTIVMANLGYFQLKAQPGVYQLRIRPGRSAQVYSIESIGTKGKWIKASSSSQQQSNYIVSRLLLTSFEGLRLFPTVKKNPGMEAEDVLEDDTNGKQHQGKEGILSALSQKLFGKKDDSAKSMMTASGQADINIFSVASGHLYERFLAIMMASVMEHTDSTVKFWFIENFLSPSFKDFVPELSKRYGFDYEMVTYKWPSWLNAQKEKQRTIWGYKILFLDVLFPLDLEKVIFVDADQIVRADLKELVDLDLHGAPYGYTPFCSDRHEMDGFRFWSQGYWKEHLRGRPYHISALYVVDLVRFRQLAAGDRLRAQYQQLSGDPNSLANLDQDLPNNMIHSVPIFSLPQEWLWCETWCSDESLKKAKTIDLCNNPLTKEPKLDRARRQVPEWSTYDTHIEQIRQAFLQQKSTGQEPADKSNDSTKQKAKSVHIKDEL